MRFIVIILAITIIAGCGPTAYQQGKMDLQQQYADLDQIQDLGLRQQRLGEIQHRELILEAQEANRRQIGAQLFGAWLGYQAQTQPKTYNVNVFGLK